MARPKKEIDEEVLRSLCAIGCTTEEMAAVLNVDPRTLERRFAGKLRTWKESGKTSLRRMQWKAAQGGNVTMLIWLGKQLLGQQDRHEHEHTGRNGGPIEIADVRAKLASGLARLAERDPAAGDTPGAD